MSPLSTFSNRTLALVVVSTFMSLAGVMAAGATPSASPGAGPVIVQGVLYDADGSRAGAGERVTLTAWPTSEVLADLAVGDPVPTLIAGVATTDASGGFAVRYSDPSALASYVDADGTVDFSLDSEAGGVTHSYSLSRTVPTSSRTQAQLFAPIGADDPELQPVDLRPLSGSKTSANDAARSARNAPVPARSFSPALGPFCTWVVVSNLGNRWVRVGAATTTTGVTATFKYSSGGTSTIGVAASVSGKVGSFSASGTTTVTSNASVTMPKVSGVASKIFRTQFVFKKFAYRCNNGIGDVKFEVRATSFAGGSSTLSTTNTPVATHCTPYQPDSIFDTRRTNATAQAWSAGASLAGDIGINLSSQSGYSSSVSLVFVFAKARKLCGTNANPALAARLVAK